MSLPHLSRWFSTQVSNFHDDDPWKDSQKLWSSVTVKWPWVWCTSHGEGWEEAEGMLAFLSINFLISMDTTWSLLQLLSVQPRNTECLAYQQLWYWNYTSTVFPKDFITILIVLVFSNTYWEISALLYVNMNTPSSCLGGLPNLTRYRFNWCETNLLCRTKIPLLAHVELPPTLALVPCERQCCSDCRALG